MNGFDFLDFAKSLLSSSNEAARRTSVSRSYYAIYHQMKEILTSLGIPVSRQPSEHQRLVRYLKEGGKNAGIQNASRYGEFFDSLREERNNADYDLSVQKFNERNCKLQWRVAEMIYNIINANLVEYKRSFVNYAKRINEYHS